MVFGLWYYKKNTFIKVGDGKLVFRQPLNKTFTCDIKNIKTVKIEAYGVGASVLAVYLNDGSSHIIRGVFTNAQYKEVLNAINN